MERAMTEQTTLTNHYRVYPCNQKQNRWSVTNAVPDITPVNMKFTVSSSLKCCEFHVNSIMDDVMFVALVIFRNGQAVLLPQGEKKKRRNKTV